MGAALCSDDGTRGARRELPSDGIMILFNNEHNGFMVCMLSPFFQECTRGFGVVLVVLVLLSLSLSFCDVGLNLRKLSEIEIDSPS